MKKVTSSQITGRASDNLIKIQKQSILKDTLNNVVINDKNLNSDYKELIIKNSDNDPKKNIRQSISLNNQQIE